LLKQSVAAALNDSGEMLRRAEMARAEKSVQGGLHGPIAVNAQILTLYQEYQRRAEAILECIQKVLKGSSFRYYRKLHDDLRAFFLAECHAHSSEILSKLHDLPSGGKPSFGVFKQELHQKLLADVSLAAESYLTHHSEVTRSWWVAHGTAVLKWIIGIVTALLVAWLTKLWIN